LRQASTALFIAIDSLLPARGPFLPGFDEFTAALDHLGIPAVWLTRRSRLHLDEPRRKLGHAHPFIAENGCGIYLPEGYFHLRPDTAPPRAQKSATLRLGRFTCIPVAEILPAAAEALERLSEDTAVPVVTLSSLSSRELAQNTGLPAREAALARQRDFDELFFFAGASENQVQRFLEEGHRRNLELRQDGVLWSIAIGASIQRSIRELSKLYDRALRCHARTVGIAGPQEAATLFPSCERGILLADDVPEEPSPDRLSGRRIRRIRFHGSQDWAQLLEAIASGI